MRGFDQFQVFFLTNKIFIPNATLVSRRLLQEHFILVLKPNQARLFGLEK